MTLTYSSPPPAARPAGAPLPKERKVSDHHQTYWISRRIFWVQGIYFAITGIWPLVNMASFEAVTGPKMDHWLVQTVGAILVVIGVSLCAAARARVLNAGNYLLGAGSALALMIVDIVFTANRSIDPIYLVDAGAECLLLIAWATLGFLALREHRADDRRYLRHLAMALR
jgi:hypothetical protein